MAGFTTRRHEMTGHPLKYYRVVRKYFAKAYDIKDADLEVLIELDDEYFDQKRFRQATLTHSWNKKRLDQLIEGGWVEEWRAHQPSSHSAALYKVCGKTHQLISRIYNILNGKEDLPMSYRRNPLERNPNNLTYSEKLLRNAVRLLNKDQQQNKYE